MIKLYNAIQTVQGDPNYLSKRGAIFKGRRKYTIKLYQAKGVVLLSEVGTFLV